jgi:hypothetical protein
MHSFQAYFIRAGLPGHGTGIHSLRTTTVRESAVQYFPFTLSLPLGLYKKRKPMLALSRRGSGNEGPAQTQHAAFRGGSRHKHRGKNHLEIRFGFQRVSGVTSAECAVWAEN